MNYTVRKLSPVLASTFTDYISKLDFGHAPHWSTCFCRYYHHSCSYEEWQKRSGNENKEEAVSEIEAGNMNGYLAFDGEKCIGWCNVNDIRQFVRLENEMKDIVKEQKIGCAICFLIHPEYRRQGVARLLLKTAVEDFREQGYDAVLALPSKAFDSPELNYRGTMNMYIEFGFEEIEKRENHSVMRLILKN